VQQLHAHIHLITIQEHGKQLANRSKSPKFYEFLTNPNPNLSHYKYLQSESKRDKHGGKKIVHKNTAKQNRSKTQRQKNNSTNPYTNYGSRTHTTRRRIRTAKASTSVHEPSCTTRTTHTSRTQPQQHLAGRGTHTHAALTHAPTAKQTQYTVASLSTGKKLPFFVVFNYF